MLADAAHIDPPLSKTLRSESVFFCSNRRDSLRDFGHDRGHAGSMETVATLLELARAIREAPDTPATRRVLERFGRGEIDARRAIDEPRSESRRTRPTANASRDG